MSASHNRFEQAKPQPVSVGYRLIVIHACADSSGNVPLTIIAYRSIKSIFRFYIDKAVRNG